MTKNFTTEPKQYRQGWTEFYKLRFNLTRDVLIPRPETELLVDEVLRLGNGIAASSRLGGTSRNDASRLVGSHNDVIASGAKQSLTVLDLGTGSGCVAISIAKNLPSAKIIATDISEKALKVAQLNAKSQKVDGRVVFVINDLLEGFKVAPDIIVANLPYIPSARLAYIDPMVSECEPKVALDGGPDGFELYRKLFTQIEQQKIYPKYLIAEIDYTHGELAVDEALKYFPNASAWVKLDLAKRQRILIVKF